MDQVEDFNGLSNLTHSDLIERTHWDAKWGAAVTSAGDDGQLRLAPIAVDEHETVTISFDAKAYLKGHANFEEKGQNGEDSLKVQVKDANGHWNTIETFYWDNDKKAFVGEVTQQEFSLGSYDPIEFTGIEGVNGFAEVRLYSEITACNEFIKIDNLAIECVELPKDGDCETETLLHENFDHVHRPDDSDHVVSDDHWYICDDKAVAEGHAGALTFKPVQLDGHKAGTFSFDIEACGLHNFEGKGQHYEDVIKVQLSVDGGHTWFTLDEFYVNKHEGVFESHLSDRTFTEGHPTTLSYYNDNLPDGASEAQFRIILDATAHNEKIKVDNVKITAEKECDDCPEGSIKIDFNDLDKGETQLDLDHVTITATANVKKVVHIEAEDFQYKHGVEHKHNDHASGGEHVNAWGHGTIATAFTGHTGEYEIFIDVQDETDGAGYLDVYVGGNLIETIKIEGKEGESGHTAGSDHGKFSTFKLTTPVEIAEHAEIKLVYNGDGHEMGRIDKVKFVSTETTVENRQMIFDSKHPTGGDHDLAYDNQGKILIISEDGDSSDPDDNARGGDIHFDFDAPSTVTSFTVLDNEEGGTITLLAADGTVISQIDLPTTPNNGKAVVDLDVSGVDKMIVTFNGSGAIDDLCFKKDDVPLLGALSGRYFCDVDNDDIDDDEPGIEDVLVTLFDPAGNAVATTFTDAEGNYLFDGLDPGTYSVEFTDPNNALIGKQLVNPNVGDDDTVDSDAIGDTISSTITDIEVFGGEENKDNDAGAEKTASLGDFVFLDDNADGIQDAGEVGIAGVTVTLTGGGADGVIGTADDTSETTTTDSTGFYEFTNLNPGEEYQVTFEQPAGFEVSPADQGGDDTVDSDGLVTEIVTLAPGENNPTLDQGFYELAGLGDFVFLDNNGNGIQDAGDTPVENVTVQLKDAGDNVIASTTTNAQGFYSFTGLIPGTYSVAFIAPAGFAFTAPNQGADDALDSDADPVSGMTQQVTLTSGEFNGTLDAGLVELNTPPTPVDDARTFCVGLKFQLDADGNRIPDGLGGFLEESRGDIMDPLNLLANDPADPDGDPLTVVSISDDDETVGVGQSLTTAEGVIVTLLNDQGDVSIDRDTAAPDLLIGDTRADFFEYTVTDGTDTASATVNLTLKGDVSTLDTVDDLSAALSGDAGIVTAVLLQDLTPGGDLYGFEQISVEFPDTQIGRALSQLPEPIDLAFCLSVFTPIDVGVPIQFTVDVLDEDSYLAAIGGAIASPFGDPPNAANIDSVSWLLNEADDLLTNGLNGRDIGEGDIQQAIYILLDNAGRPQFDNFFANNPQFGERDDAFAVADLALAQGDGFVPGIDDIIPVVLDPVDDGVQPFVIGLPFSVFEEDCFC